MKDPILSIVIPVYNSEAYLADAVTSVLKQSGKGLEILIVDDGSKDYSGAIADQFSAKYNNIRVFHVPNGGVSAARNYGIREAKGQYIGFLDADDVMCKNAYTDEICSILAQGMFDIISFSYFVSTENLEHGRRHSTEAGLFLRDQKEYLRQTQKHFSSFLYHKNLFTENIRFPEGIRYSEDVAFLFLVSRSSRHIMQYSEPWFIHRMHAASVMHAINSSDYILKDVVEVWDWCKANCTTDDDRNVCNSSIFLNIVEYIRSSCAYGVKVETIIHNVASNKPFNKAMEHYGHFWVSREYDELYNEFMQHPHKIWKKCRIIGCLHNLARKLSWTRLGSKLNRIFRYRQGLSDFLP